MDRVRVITIDNLAERERGLVPEYHLEQMPNKIVERILKENTHDASPDVIRASLDTAGGFVLIAVDLCRHYARASFTGILGPSRMISKGIFTND